MFSLATIKMTYDYKKHKRKCPACLCEETSLFQKIEKLPLLLFPVPKHTSQHIKQKDLISWHCTNCNHVFHDPLNSEDLRLLYGSYYKYYPYDNLETMLAPYRIPFEEFFIELTNKLNGNGKEYYQLLEIGCSSGEQLTFYNHFNFDVLGIDPSPLKSCSTKNLISGIYEQFNFKKKFDLIIGKFVLEHVNNLQVFFKKLHKDLSDDGIAILQVPNSTVYASNSTPLFLAHEHIHYFNRYSLAISAETNGFKVVQASIDNSQSLIYAFAKSDSHLHGLNISPIEDNFFSEYLNRVKNLYAQIDRFLSKNVTNPLVFYGSGLILNWLLYVKGLPVGFENLSIVDDNKLLQGLCMPGTDIAITTYKLSKFFPGSIVILSLNPVYHKKVLPKLLDNNLIESIYGITTGGFVRLN